ncbi:carbohydrate kinase family protein [Winogradskyella sp.]|uniref:carbohydrate kinase family protein n=1 Tax=Winogradskyella sp. TaxID=1883156 RepID=UPI003BAC815D
MNKRIVCFGEVLFDVFPTHRSIGGAPLNVSFRLQSLGNSVDLISRIGDDYLGTEILQFIRQHHLASKNIQIDTIHDTSEVKVTLDDLGNASYDIVKPCAWDFIEVNTTALEAVKASEAFIFGSLSCRSQASKSSLLQLLPEASYKIFDVNLRAPHYQFDVVEDLMRQSDFTKFNDEELLLICENLGQKNLVLTDAISYIAEATSTDTICVTRGANGALLYKNGSFYEHEGYKVHVADTVGAGDSFLAGIIDQLLKGKTASKALDFACKIGSLVASKKGANPMINF